MEYPAIAPFYSNVDTTNANSSTSISFSSSRNGINLDRATATVKQGFSDALDFKAVDVFVITWENVGRFKEKNDLQNTFQVICEYFRSKICDKNNLNKSLELIAKGGYNMRRRGNLCGIFIP